MTKPNLENDFGFYGIMTDPIVGYERLAQVLCTQGVRLVQLRMKERPRDEVRAVAKAVRQIVKRPSLFIINDDPELAAEVEADGVHLGQDDMAYAQARRIVGPHAVIGLSTHTPQQCAAACALGPDYIGIGPVFPTPTKKIADPALGIEGMARMLAMATVPTVVLGALDETNLDQVFAAGAKGYASVRPLNQAHEPGLILNELQKIERQTKGPR